MYIREYVRANRLKRKNTDRLHSKTGGRGCSSSSYAASILLRLDRRHPVSRFQPNKFRLHHPDDWRIVRIAINTHHLLWIFFQVEQLPFVCIVKVNELVSVCTHPFMRRHMVFAAFVIVVINALSPASRLLAA